MSGRVPLRKTVAMTGFLLAASHHGGAMAAATVLYDFKDSPDGALSSATLLSNGGGGFYGTTERGGTGNCPIQETLTKAGCGTVFELLPPAKGETRWTEKVLYSFKGKQDGAIPVFGLIAVGGDLYGTTTSGGGAASCAVTGTSPGGCGTVFRLTPPAKGKTGWTETVVYRFKGGVTDGSAPGGALMADGGFLYGATASGGVATCKANFVTLAGCGVVFKLKPPAAGKTAGTEQVIYKFRGGTDGIKPGYGLVLSGGALYGTTQYGGGSKCPDTLDPGCGTVFKLTPVSGKIAWTETKIHDFTPGKTDGNYPLSALEADAAGTLYGTTSAGGTGTCTLPGTSITGCGIVFKLTPPAKGKTVWAEDVLLDFKGNAAGGMPQSGVTADTAGNLYGVAGAQATGTGTVYKLAKPKTGAKWSTSTLASFPLGSSSGYNPVAGLRVSGGFLYGSTLLGGAGCSGCGTIFRVAE
jgi:uncharacterized repeat protein (TIGR03803 family)